MECVPSASLKSTAEYVASVVGSRLDGLKVVVREHVPCERADGGSRCKRVHFFISSSAASNEPVQIGKDHLVQGRELIVFRDLWEGRDEPSDVPEFRQEFRCSLDPLERTTDVTSRYVTFEA